MSLPKYVVPWHFLCQFNITKSQNRLNIDKLLPAFQNVTWMDSGMVSHAFLLSGAPWAQPFLSVPIAYWSLVLLTDWSTKMFTRRLFICIPEPSHHPQQRLLSLLIRCCSSHSPGSQCQLLALVSFLGCDNILDGSNLRNDRFILVHVFRGILVTRLFSCSLVVKPENMTEGSAVTENMTRLPASCYPGSTRMEKHRGCSISSKVMPYITPFCQVGPAP